MLSSFPWGQIGHDVASALLILVMNPLLYIGFALILWDFSRNGKFEKKFFGVRVTKSWGTVLSLWLQSIVIGLLLTVACAVVGVVITADEVWFVVGLSLLFGVIRLRFLSPAYSIATWIVLATLSRFWTPSGWGSTFTSWWNVLSDFHVVSWLALLALACLAEGLVLSLNRNQSAFPVAVLSKRGRSIGGFVVKLAFIAPVLVITPGGDIATAGLPHAWPWLVGAQSGFSLFALPLLLGHSGLFTTTRPRDGLQRMWQSSLYSGGLLAVVVYVSYQFGAAYCVIGAVLVIASKEWILLRGEQVENRLDPFFTPTPQGVRVLTTVKGSLAHTLGLYPGEIITHVNQVPVHTPYDLHFALDQNPAYAKLRVLDGRGEVRFVGNPVYSGERNKLGLILAPDSYNGSCFRPLHAGLFQTSYLRLAKHERSPEIEWLESVSAPVLKD